MKTIIQLTTLIMLMTAMNMDGGCTIAESLKPEIEKVTSEFGSISSERKQVLAEAAKFIKGQLKESKKADLTFICTHNSRRSHMSQIWAQTARNITTSMGFPHILAAQKPQHVTRAQ